MIVNNEALPLNRQEVKAKQRCLYADIARGIAIIFVVIGHTVVTNSFLDLFSFSFHMPLFFVISGIFFSTKYSFWVFFRKKAIRLLLPLVIYVLFCFYLNNALTAREIMWNFLYSSGAISPVMQNVFSPVPWFLQCLFISSIIFYALLKLQEKLKINDFKFFIIVLSVSIVGFCLTNFGCFRISWIPYLPFSIDLALVSQLFLYVGLMTNKHHIFKNLFSGYLIAFVFVCLVSWLIPVFLVGIIPKNHVIISMNDRVISPFSIIISIAGSIVVLYVSKWLEKLKIINVILAYFGQISLIIYLFHLFQIRLFSVFFMINLYTVNTALTILLRLIQSIIFAEIFRIIPGINYILGLRPFKFEQKLWERSLH